MWYEMYIIRATDLHSLVEGKLSKDEVSCRRGPYEHAELSESLKSLKVTIRDRMENLEKPIGFTDTANLWSSFSDPENSAPCYSKFLSRMSIARFPVTRRKVGMPVRVIWMIPTSWMRPFRARE